MPLQVDVRSGDDVGRRDRLDAAWQPVCQVGTQALADEGRTAGASEDHAQLRPGEQGPQECFEFALARDQELMRLQQHRGLLRDLARGPQRVSRAQHRIVDSQAGHASAPPDGMQAEL